jgi:hypothetical protein
MLASVQCGNILIYKKLSGFSIRFGIDSGMFDAFHVLCGFLNIFCFIFLMMLLTG